ncbi:MAG TPA: helicase-related protein [bacterium]|nr:helicase-related protein [bacterium]HQN72495.1 helicase-related protein [bacterium]
MLYDNEKKKICEWIREYTKEGTMDIVTGYLTVAAISYVSDCANAKIRNFRIIAGELVENQNIDERTIDLLNENISVDAALEISTVARNAVDFLKQDKVLMKTLEPNFCHAKAYIFKAKEKDDPANYFILGSSNLTEAGLGLKKTSNVELNIVGQGTDANYGQLHDWFEELWKKPQAHSDKTLGKKGEKIDFKEYLIKEISMLFIKYNPDQIYYKILHELFKAEIEVSNDKDFERQIGRLQNSVVYNSLYDFQQKGVLSLIKMIEKYNGAILADAVGLGKTWTALAVIKFYQSKGRDAVVFCPKKLEHNWKMFLKRQSSKFEEDQFGYLVKFHTDLDERLIQKGGETLPDYWTNDKPKLFIIDESHNLRNDKSQRYQFLVNEILKKNHDVKVLLLSATPINNSFIDIRNQFRLIVKGDDTGFAQSLDVKNLLHAFKDVQRVFNEWTQEENRSSNDFVRRLKSDNFFKLTDSLIVARTRKMIEKQCNLVFPETDYDPQRDNIFKTPVEMGNFESFEDIFNAFPPKLSAYQPALYTSEKHVKVIEDDKIRDTFLVKMIYILLVKRLESSWKSFKATVEKISEYHQKVFNYIKDYEERKKDLKIKDDIQGKLFNDDDDLAVLFENYQIGKKRTITIREIDLSGKLADYKNDLKKDMESLDKLTMQVSRFNSIIEKEKGKNSKDSKLAALISRIDEKRKNSSNKKVLIFTTFADTAEYLYTELLRRGFDKIAVVTGGDSYSSYSSVKHSNFEPLLQQFAPFTKLFLEREWSGFEFDKEKTRSEQFDDWKKWIIENRSDIAEKIQNPIDILITTDCLSEGQNLQDADFVINYDIHWNPVRLIQRVGRIDRLGSPNKKIRMLNFWPAENINAYLSLQKRIENKIIAMTLAGSEVNRGLTENLKERMKEDSLEERQNRKMLEQMQVKWEDIETNESSIGFDTLSLEKFRQELMAEFEKNKKYYDRMPSGIYSGFGNDKKGIIAMLAYPTKPPKVRNYNYSIYELIFINDNGSLVLNNEKEVLDFLSQNKLAERSVSEKIDSGEKEEILKLQNSIKKWFENKKTSEPSSLLDKIKKGDSFSIDKVKKHGSVENIYQIEKWDLIAWMIIE